MIEPVALSNFFLSFFTAAMIILTAAVGRQLDSHDLLTLCIYRHMEFATGSTLACTVFTHLHHTLSTLLN